MDFIDLGLPSGTLWGKYNLGARSELEDGQYFSWGNVDGYSADDGYDFKGHEGDDFTNPYASTIGASLSDNILPGGANDAAAVIIGNSCEIPSEADVQELMNPENCSSTWVENYQGSGRSGRLVTSERNGNQLFIPATGFFDGIYHMRLNLYAYTWLSNIIESNHMYASCLVANDVHISIGSAGNYRHYGYTIRPVKRVTT